MKRPVTFAIFAMLAAAAIMLAAPAVLSRAANLPSFPGGLGSADSGASSGAAAPVSAEARLGGRAFQVTSVLADAEQTVVAYHIEGRAGEGAYAVPAPGPRLVLGDGTVIGYRFIGASQRSDGNGSIVFPPLPAGIHTVTLEVDGLLLGQSPSEDPLAVNGRFAVRFDVDNRAGYAASIRVPVSKHGGTGKGLVTITEVSRTPSLVVIRGTIDGLTPEAIQALGRPSVSLIRPDGTTVESESGRLGFGDGYRQIEIRFPGTVSGHATLAVRGLSGNPQEDAFIGLDIP